MRKIIPVVLALLLAGCSGGGGTSQIETAPQAFSKPAYQSPNYHPHAYPSHAFEAYDQTYIGGDVEPREKLRRFGTVNGITHSMGASRDGVGKNRIENYDRDLASSSPTDGFYPFITKPKIWLNSNFNESLVAEDTQAMETFIALFDSIRILNDVLPPEFQIEFAQQGDIFEGEGSLEVKYVPADDITRECGGSAVACSIGHTSGTRTKYSNIIIPDNIDTSDHNNSRTVIIHELLHALGVRGHVDSTEFPDSIMGKSGDFFPNPGFTIHRIDREVLQIMYMSQRTANYNDFGEWSDNSLHLVGASDDGHVNFGIALFNGLPLPWARGTTPNSTLSQNNLITGTVSWDGTLLAFSGSSPVIGTTELTVDMNNLASTQDLKFSDLYFLNRIESTSSDRWFPNRNINYDVTMSTYGFYHLSSNGQVIGAFMGPRHEGMAGTLKRTDLVGAFGGTRD